MQNRPASLRLFSIAISFFLLASGLSSISYARVSTFKPVTLPDLTPTKGAKPSFASNLTGDIKVIQSTLTATPLATVASLSSDSMPTWGDVTSHLGHVCVEDYMTAGMNGDYGQAINAAISAQPLTQQTQLTICSSGDHPISTQVVFNRPISFWMSGSRLIPTASLASSPVSISGCTATAGSTSLTCPNTNGLQVGMAIGGVGICGSAYITSISGSTINISLPADITYNAVPVAGSSRLYGLSSQRGLALQQSITGFGIPASAVITGIDPNSNSITMNLPATSSPAGPASFSLSPGETWTTAIRAITVRPVLRWVWNQNALHNNEGQMIGGEMHGVTIADPGYRTLQGVQGVQIYGWDSFSSDDLEIQDLAGSELILGGSTTDSSYGIHGAVRESDFFNTTLHGGGEGLTGQPVLEMMTPRSQNVPSADEINQIGFVSGHLSCWVGDGVDIGTFNNSHTGTMGPRLLWFSDDFQIEGCGSASANIVAPYDVVHIMRAGDVYFSNAEIAAPGYGKAVFRVDNMDHLSVSGSRLYASNKSASYSVTVKPGSTQVTFLSGPAGAFDSRGYWDGQGVTINDGQSCTPCYLLLSSTNAVSGDGKTLALAGLYPGTASSSATLTIGFTGYYINITQSLGKLTATGNTYNDPNPVNWPFFRLTNARQSFLVGSGYLRATLAGSNDYLGGGSMVQVTNPGANYQILGQFWGPNVSTGNSATLYVGASDSPNNTAILGWTNFGNGSSSNYGWLGMHGTSGTKPALMWFSNGFVQTAVGNNVLDDGTGNAIFQGRLSASRANFVNGVTAPNIGGNYPTCNGTVVPCHILLTGQRASTDWTTLYTPTLDSLYQVTVYYWTASPTGTAGATATAMVQYNNYTAAVTPPSAFGGVLDLTRTSAPQSGSTLVFDKKGEPIQFRTAVNGATNGFLYGVGLVIEPK